MPIEIPSEDAAGTVPSKQLAASEVFSALAHDRRRYVLHYLSRRVGAVSIADLGEWIAIREGEPTADRYERILTDLYHTHLPGLAELDLLTYDLEREEVALAAAADGVRPYLDLAVEDDLQ